MPFDAVSDTGPVRHLWEIGQEEILTLFSTVCLPEAVKTELTTQGVWENLSRTAVNLFKVQSVKAKDISDILATFEESSIQPTDAAVVVLAKQHRPSVVLTDDLQLRKVLESLALPVVGSVGLLIRAFRTGRFDKADLEMLIDRLFNGSTLYLSAAFKSRVRQMIQNLPSHF